MEFILHTTASVFIVAGVYIHGECLSMMWAYYGACNLSDLRVVEIKASLSPIVSYLL